MIILNKIQVGNPMLYYWKVLILLTVSIFLMGSCDTGVHKRDSPKENKTSDIPEPLKIGYSVSINDITLKKLHHAKSVGIDYIELSGTNTFFDKNGNFDESKAEIEEKFKKVKMVLDETGINVWSVHMPFSQYIDLSVIYEED